MISVAHPTSKPLEDLSQMADINHEVWGNQDDVVEVDEQGCPV